MFMLVEVLLMAICVSIYVSIYQLFYAAQVFYSDTFGHKAHICGIGNFRSVSINIWENITFLEVIEESFVCISCPDNTPCKIGSSYESFIVMVDVACLI